MNNISNLIDLKELNLENILEVLQERYLKNNIYTKINEILLAINPFKKIHVGKDEPHPDDIAIQCVNDLKKNGNCHSILVSGESGAGKTETTKIILKKLLNIVDKNEMNEINENLLEQIYWSNYILESFGNSKTIRNHNSSRFGKFINLYYENDKIVGAKIETYLLEKIRVTKKNINERNYHIFYQLFPELVKEKILFSNNLLDDNLDDESSKFELFQAFKYFGIKESQIEEIKKILLIIIHLGDYQNKKQILSNLLNIEIEFLEKYLEGKFIKVGNENIYKKLDEKDLLVKIETFQQELYSNLFDYLVKLINLELSKNLSNKNYNFIGILDIFGFEILNNNSLEQLCINYTNEILQNTFNKYFFEKEQELYISEGLPFDLVKFENNDFIISKIEKDLFKTINEVTKFIKGNDKQIMELIFNQKDNILEINNLQKSKLLFEINHYADKVEYSLIDFIDKNKLEFPNELKDIITKSSIEIFKNFNINNSKDKLLDKFIKEIYSLQNKINSTKVNFIRCLKPNDEMIPLKINHHRLTQQLKYNGVIEAIRVARQGYPIRIKNEIFYKLYHFVPINFNLIQGKNLTFLNKEQELYLEKMRYQILNQKAILIQSLFKSFIVRKKFINFKNNFIKLQANIKSKIQRNKFIKLLQNYKAIKIQKIIRGFISKNKFQKIKFIVLWWKFKFIWNKILYNKKIKASKTIIKFFKHLSFLSKIKKLSKIYQKIIGFILIIKAKQILKNLKIQAKDIQNIIEEKNKLLILLNIKHQQELNDKLLKDKLFKEKELESEAKERLLMEKEELIIMEIKREEDNKRLVDAIAEKDLRFIEEISKMNQELEEMRKLLEKSKNENKNKIGGDSCNVM